MSIWPSPFTSPLPAGAPPPAPAPIAAASERIPPRMSSAAAETNSTEVMKPMAFFMGSPLQKTLAAEIRGRTRGTGSPARAARDRPRIYSVDERLRSLPRTGKLRIPLFLPSAAASTTPLPLRTPPSPGGTGLARTPPQLCEVDTASSVEAHPLPLEPEPLQGLKVAAVWTPGYLSRSVHDAMPRDPAVFFEGAECITDE